MTKLEFLKKYGEVRVVFSSYFKHVFCFKGQTLNGDSLVVWIGGDANGIYDMDITRDTKVTVASLDVVAGRVRRGGVDLEGFDE